MSDKNYRSQEQKLKSDTIQALQKPVNKYAKTFYSKLNSTGSVPSIDEIENTLAEIKSETHNIYLNMVSQSISELDESEMIKAKKENTKKEG